VAGQSAGRKRSIWPHHCTSRGAPGGVAAGESCVFPFKYHGVTYNSCHNAPQKSDAGFGTGQICAVRKLGINRELITYGYCGSGCFATGGLPTDYHCTSRGAPGVLPGEKCVFPFQYSGVTYYNCHQAPHKTDIGFGSGPICAVRKLGLNQQLITYGYCGTGCTLKGPIPTKPPKSFDSCIEPHSRAEHKKYISLPRQTRQNCINKCKDDSSCEYWSWHRKRKNCLLYHAKMSHAANSNFDSGSRSAKISPRLPVLHYPPPQKTQFPNCATSNCAQWKIYLITSKMNIFQ